jgi:hypothetical protein
MMPIFDEPWDAAESDRLRSAMQAEPAVRYGIADREPSKPAAEGVTAFGFGPGAGEPTAVCFTRHSIEVSNGTRN